MNARSVGSFFARAADALGLEENLRNALSVPQREIALQLRLPLDDGGTKILRGWRVQHNDARGPFKGGIRFHPDVNIEELRTFASLMTWKTALLNLPLGGGKGGIAVDTRLLSTHEFEILARTFLRKLVPVIGPEVDVMAPDVNTDERVMHWMLDEYGEVVGNDPAIVTGKPAVCGGLEARPAATGRGAFFCLEAIAQAFRWNRSSCRIAIQGFGAAGRHLALSAVAAGFPLVAVCDSKGTVVNPAGLDPTRLLEHKRETGSVVDASDSETVEADAILAVDCDVLAPAALEGAIDATNCDEVKARMVLEVANYPVSPAASDALEGRKVVVIPDILANAGGVCVSYMEWARDTGREEIAQEQVDDRLRAMMRRSTDAILRRAKERGASLRQAAYEIAVSLVAQAEERRGEIKKPTR
jgi:glutamate dehydrogenase (NAD(P)+)